MTYQAVVSADNPLHYWRLADPGGFIAHDIGSAPVHLSAFKYLASMPYTGPSLDGGSAFFSNAASFNMQDQVLQAYPVTLEAWFWQQQRNGHIQTSVSLELNGGAQALSLLVSATGFPEAASGGVLLVAPAAMTTQTWHHLVVVHTGLLRRLYVDGALVANDAQVRANDLSVLSVGARGGDNGIAAEGCLSEVAVYNYALIAAQITAHFNAADNRAQSPIFRTTGTFSVVTGSSTVTSEQVTGILSDVQKNLGNTP